MNSESAVGTSLARELHTAWTSRAPIAPVGQRYPALTVDDAYDIQRQLLELLQGDADRIAGYKVGLTSAAMQQMLGVDQPDFAALLATMRIANGGTLDRAELIQPMAEAEICIVIDQPVAGPGITAADVASASRGLSASIEVIDSRIENWQIGLVDTVADLASAGRFVISDQVLPLGDYDPRLIGAAVYLNGRVEATGAGAAALGDPFEAAAWTVNTLARYGVAIEAGHVIMTGAVHPAIRVDTGDTVRASFDRLGDVEVTFG